MRRFFLLAICLFVTAALAPAAFAQSDVGFKGLGARVSYVAPDNVDGTVGFGGVVDLGTFKPQVGFGATLDYWSGSNGPIDFSDFIIGANSRYLFEVKNPKLKPYAGGGLAFHFFKVDIPSVNLGPFGTVGGGSTSDTKIGVDLFGGTGFAVGKKVDLTGELMYRIVSDVSQFVISAGVIFWLGGEGK